MNLSDKAKKAWAFFWYTVMLVVLLSFMIIETTRELFQLLNNADKIYYDSKGILGLGGVPFLIISYIYLLLELIITDTNIFVTNKKSKKKAIKFIQNLLAPFLVISILIFFASIFIAPFVTHYVHDHYTACHYHTGIFNGTTYVKGNATCK